MKWPGCHVAHHRAAWTLGVQSLASAGLADVDSDDLPDISVDPRRKILSVINSSGRDRCFFLSVPAAYECCGRAGRKLEVGQSRDASGAEEALVTFVLVVGPRMVMDICKLRGLVDARDAKIRSDILDLSPPPKALLGREGFPHRFVYSFPLPGPGPYLCSQGSGGHLSHFAHPSTYHAVDLDCEVGTPVLAIGDGVVQEIRDNESASGIDVQHFFKWNQVTVLQSDGVLVEYVHIAAGSASEEQHLSAGSAVKCGQQLCRSGAVGFCPTPHLHLEVHAEAGAQAVSVQFGFRGRTETAGPFQCEEGRWYGPEGHAQTD